MQPQYGQQITVTPTNSQMGTEESQPPVATEKKAVSLRFEDVQLLF